MVVGEEIKLLNMERRATQSHQLCHLTADDHHHPAIRHVLGPWDRGGAQCAVDKGAWQRLLGHQHIDGLGSRDDTAFQGVVGVGAISLGLDLDDGVGRLATGDGGGDLEPVVARR